MANSTSAYRLDAFPLYEPAMQPQTAHTSVRAVRTGGAAQANQLTPQLIMLARMAAIVLAVVALLGFARIALTNAAVATMIESDSITAQIDEARTSGVSMEMDQSVMTSPTAIKNAAKRLGMSEPGEVGTLVLDPDIVVLDEQGSLSLSGSVKSAVLAQE